MSTFWKRFLASAFVAATEAALEAAKNRQSANAKEVAQAAAAAAAIAALAEAARPAPKPRRKRKPAAKAE